MIPDIKYLLPYLPYGLTGIVMESNNENHILLMTGINTYFDEPKIETFGLNGYDTCSVEKFKPILKPLNSLRKNYSEWERNMISELEKVEYYINDLPVKIFTDLIKYHYDVYYLIDDNLGVNNKDTLTYLNLKK